MEEGGVEGGGVGGDWFMPGVEGRWDMKKVRTGCLVGWFNTSRRKEKKVIFHSSTEPSPGIYTYKITHILY